MISNKILINDEYLYLYEQEQEGITSFPYFFSSIELSSHFLCMLYEQNLTRDFAIDILLLIMNTYHKKCYPNKIQRLRYKNIEIIVTLYDSEPIYFDIVE